MMKYSWYEDLHPSPEKYEDSIEQQGAWRIPTVDEINDTLSFMYADTVLQILRGQGIYYGYDVKRQIDNKIPKIAGAESRVWVGKRNQQIERSIISKEKQQLRMMKRTQKKYERLIARTTAKVARFRKLPLMQAELIVRSIMPFKAE